MKVLVAGALSEEIASGLEAFGLDVSRRDDITTDTLPDAIEDTDILVIGDMGVSRRALERADRLLLVVRAGVGVGRIDVGVASERAVFVSHCPGHDAAAKAEHALGELIRLDRQDGAKGLAGRTLGLAGFSCAASILSRAASALGMTVHAYAPDVTEGLASELAVRRARSMDDLLANCDVISLHPGDGWAPDFGKEELSSLEAGGLLIAAEGVEGLDLTALAGALKNGDVRASIDQDPDGLSQSDQDALEKVARSKRSRVTNEAGYTLDATQRAATEVARVVHGFLRDGSVANCVNTIAQSDAACTLVVKHRHETAVLAEVIDVLRDEEVGLREIRNTLFQDASAAHTHLRLVALPGQTVLDRLRRKESIFDVSVDM